MKNWEEINKFLKFRKKEESMKEEERKSILEKKEDQLDRLPLILRPEDQLENWLAEQIKNKNLC